jgi:nucleotide-binding universal stress UspA family protein
MKPILVAYDGSPAARHAIEEAAALLGPRPALIATIWEPGLAFAAVAPPTGIDMPIGTMSVETALEVDELERDHARRVAGEGAALARSHGFDAEPIAVPDQVNVTETLVEIARERDVAAVVVGTRGLTGLRSRLMGSTSQGLVRHSSRPVLVVHREEQGAKDA